jgi:bifunctional DNase/RNase
LGRRAVLDRAKQFEIDFVVITDIYDQQAVYLQEVDGTRFFPMLTGIFEATSLDRRFKGYDSPWPLTHDALAAGIRLLGGEVQDVLIDRLENHNYFASARIRHQGRLLLLDMRPSDAFTLAVLSDCPIFIGEGVLDQIDFEGKNK